jgi:hypothetical protein
MTVYSSAFSATAVLSVLWIGGAAFSKLIIGNDHRFYNPVFCNHGAIYFCYQITPCQNRISNMLNYPSELSRHHWSSILPLLAAPGRHETIVDVDSMWLDLLIHLRFAVSIAFCNQRCWMQRIIAYDRYQIKN